MFPSPLSLKVKLLAGDLRTAQLSHAWFASVAIRGPFFSFRSEATELDSSLGSLGSFGSLKAPWTMKSASPCVHSADRLPKKDLPRIFPRALRFFPFTGSQHLKNPLADDLTRGPGVHRAVEEVPERLGAGLPCVAALRRESPF